MTPPCSAAAFSSNSVSVIHASPSAGATSSFADACTSGSSSRPCPGYTSSSPQPADSCGSFCSPFHAIRNHADPAPHLLQLLRLKPCPRLQHLWPSPFALAIVPCQPP